MTLHLEQPSAEYALTAMIYMTALLEAEHNHLKQRGVHGLERGTARRRHEDMHRHTLAFGKALKASEGGAELLPRKDLIRALNDVAALVDVARHTLSMEDYGDALDGAARRLTTLIGQLTASKEGTCHDR